MTRLRTWEEKTQTEKQKELIHEGLFGEYPMSFEVFLRTKGEVQLTSFNSMQHFLESFDLLFAERWLFYKKIIELIETREDLSRYGDFCGSDEKVTDYLINECDYWRQVYYDKLDWEEEDFEKFESQRTPKATQNFKYGKISNGDSGIHWKSVGEAFDWICHICGHQTERKGGTHLIRRGCTVDHIVPQSKGGANTWNNVLPAHWECNIKKNANI